MRRVAAVFETHMEQFDWRVVHSRHILCKTEAEAKAITAQLDADAGFATLAKERSIDADSYTAGDDLGWKGGGQTPPEYEYAIFKLKQGKISAPNLEAMKREIGEVYIEHQIK
jgi:hypothetical protein